MGKSFQKVNACCAGNFGENSEKIPQWLRANGGTYSKDMNSDITHLITTESAFKRNVEPGMFITFLSPKAYIYIYIQDG